jgi:hypothetical protein
MLDKDNSVEIIAGMLVSDPPFGPYMVLQKFVCKLRGRFIFVPSPLCLTTSSDQVIESLVGALFNFDASHRILRGFIEKPVYLNDLIRNILAADRRYGFPLIIPTNFTIKILLLMRFIFPGIQIADRLITLLTVSPKDVLLRLKTNSRVES